MAKKKKEKAQKRKASKKRAVKKQKAVGKTKTKRKSIIDIPPPSEPVDIDTLLNQDLEIDDIAIEDDGSTAHEVDPDVEAAEDEEGYF